MRSGKGVPLHVRLVLANGLVFGFGVLAMSLAPTEERGPAALVVLAVGLTLIVAVNTRHLRRSLTALLSTIGALGGRWENERRAQRARSPRGDRVELRVSDDGVGFGASGERTGILGMRERAGRVGGSLEVLPRAGGGTEVRLDVPARHRT